MAILDGTVWATLAPWQLAALALAFLWSGFVRSGLGFGGAALTLPLLLLVVDDPLLFLPTIGCQLLVFSTLTIATRLGNVDWRFLRGLALALALPVAAGLVGLLSLSGAVLSLVVYAVTLGYGLMYLLDRGIVSRSRASDVFLVLLGGYVSGVSLTGAPLIVAVGARRLPPERLRDTLFVLWIVLVVVKLATFVAADVDLQWPLFALTLPFVTLGHVLGLRLHARLLAGGATGFRRWIGAGLAAISVVGLASTL